MLIAKNHFFTFKVEVVLAQLSMSCIKIHLVYILLVCVYTTMTIIGCICWYTVRRNNFEIPSKVAGQNPEVSTGIEIETRRNPSKPVETCHRNPSKPIETHRNLSKSKGFDFCQNGIRVLPRNLNTE